MGGNFLIVFDDAPSRVPDIYIDHSSEEADGFDQRCRAGYGAEKLKVLYVGEKGSEAA